MTTEDVRKHNVPCNGNTMGDVLPDVEETC
jgi:hypothetical protein